MFRRLRIASYEAFHVITLLVLAGIPYIYWASGQSYAAQLSDRSVAISTATPSVNVTNYIQATIGSIDPVGSIEFEYCSNSPIVNAPCTAPAGLSLTSAVLSSQTGNTGFSIDTTDSNSNTLILTRTAVPALAVASSYKFSNIVNPSTPNQTTFIRISTYGSTDAVGVFIDQGAVAFSTTSNLSVGAYIPPFLAVCAAQTVTQNCSASSGSNLDMGILTSQTTGTATSELAASTNSFNGYSIYILGTTLTSGNNIIDSITTPASSEKGINQFGLNLRQNSEPSVGADPSGLGTATPSPGYDAPNNFTFVSGSQVVNSQLSTQFNLLTVSYIANVANNDPAGIYNTTLTYLASTQF
jgi:hypothetical protein